jgi:hypothetical protein
MKFPLLEVLRKKLSNWPLGRDLVMEKLRFCELISSSQQPTKQVEQVPYPVHKWGNRFGSDGLISRARRQFSAGPELESRSPKF